MTTGYVVSGRGDLDTIFKARTSSPAAATNFLSNGGVDLNQRFEPRAATTAVPNTGFLVGSTDLAQIFMNIAASGTVIPPIGNFGFRADAVTPFIAIAGFFLENDGDIISQIDEGSGGVFTDEGDWVSPKSAAPSTFQARATVTSGLTPSGSAVGTYLALTSTIGWSLTRSTNGTSTTTFLIEIRDGTGPVLRSFSVSLTAAVSI